MFKNAWEQRTVQADATIAAHRRERDAIDVQLDKLMERIVETDNPAVIAAYERKIAALENRKPVMAEKIETGARPRHAFDGVGLPPSGGPGSKLVHRRSCDDGRASGRH